MKRLLLLGLLLQGCANQRIQEQYNADMAECSVRTNTNAELLECQHWATDRADRAHQAHRQFAATMGSNR